MIEVPRTRADGGTVGGSAVGVPVVLLCSCAADCESVGRSAGRVSVRIQQHSVDQTVDIPVRGGGGRRENFKVLGHRVQQRLAEQIIPRFLPRTEFNSHALWEVFKFFPQDRVQQLLPQCIKHCGGAVSMVFFALFHGPKKSARVAAQSSARVHAHSSSSDLSSHQMGLLDEPIVWYDDELNQAWCHFEDHQGRSFWHWLTTDHSPLVDDVPMRTLVREPQLAEQLVEVPTIVSWSLLQRTVEQNVDTPVVGGSGAGGGLPVFSQDSIFLLLQSRSFTIQLLGRVLVEVFKVYTVDRVQKRFWSRSPSPQIQVEVFKIFHQSRVPQSLLRFLPDTLVKCFSHFPPKVRR